MCRSELVYSHGSRQSLDGMSPFLVTAFLANLHKSVPPQDANDLFGGANGEAFAHVSATSNTFAPADSLTGVGSNHSSNASFALRTASSSVSPAEAQPGSSGKYAAQRFVSRSCSNTSRSFMIELYPMRSGRQSPKPSQECVCLSVRGWARAGFWPLTSGFRWAKKILKKCLPVHLCYSYV